MTPQHIKADVFSSMSLVALWMCGPTTDMVRGGRGRLDDHAGGRRQDLPRASRAGGLNLSSPLGSPAKL